MHRQVIEPHRSDYPNPIAFAEGEAVTLGRLDPECPGWIRARLDDGNEGWAPETLFTKSPDGTAITLGAYNARELNTETGERLDVLRDLHGWFWARNSVGEEGWVPLRTTTPVQSRH